LEKVMVDDARKGLKENSMALYPGNNTRISIGL
jgi:hypothetical protein